jgi:hypothetical protein
MSFIGNFVSADSVKLCFKSFNAVSILLSLAELRKRRP